MDSVDLRIINMMLHLSLYIPILLLLDGFQGEMMATKIDETAMAFFTIEGRTAPGALEHDNTPSVFIV